MIEVSRLSVGYKERPILDDLSFALREGESLLIIGHNGTGKSTLLKTLFGLLPPLSGALRVLDLVQSEITPRRLIERGARFLGQGDRGFSELKAEESRTVLTHLYGFQVRTTDFGAVDREQKVGQLSVGKRRLEALRLLSAGLPKLYFLDEPTAATDPEAQKAMLEWAHREKSRGTSFVLVEQRFEAFLDLCDVVMVIRGGKASFLGPAQEVKSRRTILESFL